MWREYIKDSMECRKDFLCYSFCSVSTKFYSCIGYSPGFSEAFVRFEIIHVFRYLGKYFFSTTIYFVIEL